MISSKKTDRFSQFAEEYAERVGAQVIRVTRDQIALSRDRIGDQPTVVLTENPALRVGATNGHLMPLAVFAVKRDGDPMGVLAVVDYPGCFDPLLDAYESGSQERPSGCTVGITVDARGATFEGKRRSEQK